MTHIFQLILFADDISAETSDSHLFVRDNKKSLKPFQMAFQKQLHCIRRAIPWNICVTFDLKGLTQNLAYVGIVHVGEGLEDLAPLVLGPHHECIHRPLNVGLVVVPSSGFPEDSCLGRSSTSCWTTIIGLWFICRAIYFLGPWNSQSRKRERGLLSLLWLFQARHWLNDEPCSNSPSSTVIAAIIVMNIVSDERRATDFLLSGKPDLTGLYFMCYKSEYNVSLRGSYALQLVLRSIQNQKRKTLDFSGS